MTRIDERLTDKGTNTTRLDAEADELEEITNSANSVSEEQSGGAEPNSAGVSASSNISPGGGTQTSPSWPVHEFDPHRPRHMGNLEVKTFPDDRLPSLSTGRD